jgi:hypothetical protein
MIRRLFVFRPFVGVYFENIFIFRSVLIGEKVHRSRRYWSTGLVVGPRIGADFLGFFEFRGFSSPQA